MNAPGLQRLILPHDGRDRLALVYRPAPAVGPLPLVVVLHGTGASAQWCAWETEWHTLAETHGFAVVYPEGTLPDPTQPHRLRSNPLRWHDGTPFPALAPLADDVGFLLALLDRLADDGIAVPGQVFVTGFSNGGAMAFRLAAHAAERVRAIAPVGCNCPPLERMPSRPIPTLHLHGSADPLVPPLGGTVTLPWGLTTTKRPLAETLAEWADAVGCAAVPLLLRADERESVWRHPGPVTFERVELVGHGHHWPGGRGGGLNPRLFGPVVTGLAGNDRILEFFRQQLSDPEASATDPR